MEPGRRQGTGRRVDLSGVSGDWAELADVEAISFVDNPYQAVQDADGLLICTEWNEFRSPNFDALRSAMRQRVIFDGRNLYEAQTMLRQRIEYHSVGRPPAIPKRGSVLPPATYGM